MIGVEVEVSGLLVVSALSGLVLDSELIDEFSVVLLVSGLLVLSPLLELESGLDEKPRSRDASRSFEIAG